jgi:amino acid adenylation domain-containing protein
MPVRNLADYLEASAALYPHHPAVVDSGGNSITYEELNLQVDALAGFLSMSGIGPGDRVGMMVPKSISAIVAIFGIMRAGAAYVPVDPSAPIERGSRILTDCQVAAIIIDDRLLEAVPDSEHQLRAIITVGSEGHRDFSGQKTTPLPVVLQSGKSMTPAPGSASDLAYILYTSGSTGMPKGVMISHSNVLSFVEWFSSTFAPQPQDRFGNSAPLHFDASVLELYPALKYGATVYLVSDDLSKNPKELGRFIVINRLTVWFSTPTALVFLTQFGDLSARDASSLRLVLFGGEIFPVKHLRELQQQWPSPRYYNLYGPTEITVACTYARIPAPIPADREKPFPIGFPCSHCQTLVLDSDGREVPEGEEGFLHISGPSVSAGYWNRPAENAAAFVYRDNVRWYNTGDVVRWDPAEGFSYLGRKDRMIKRRGYRIELDEIERTLHLHPQVQEAAVVSVPDADAGVKIVAFLALRQSHARSVIELKTFCSSKLPSYMSPDRFIFQDRLPRTSSAKLDYQELKAEAALSKI